MFLSLTTSGGSCEYPYFRYFNILYSFTSLFGVVSHVITGNCGDDTLEIVLGNASQGQNLLGVTSFAITTGDEFGGSVVVDSNSIMGGTSPLSCEIIVTLTDANGGQASASVNLSVPCSPPP